MNYLSRSICLIVSHWRQLVSLSIQDLRNQYAGSVLGLGWAMIAPLLLMSLYASIYLVIFKVRAPGMESGEYVLYVFSGFVPYLMTANVIGLGVGSLAANRDLLTNTIFPVDLVSPRIVISSQPTMIVGLLLTLSGCALIGELNYTLILLPLLWLLQLMALTGLVWLLSLLAVLLPDIKNLVPVVLMAMLVASPFAYTPEMVPESLKVVIILNPMAYFVIAYQHIILLGEFPPPWMTAVLVSMSLTLFFVGGFVFSKSKAAIADHV